MVLDATTTGFLPPWLDNLAVAWFILGACLIGALTAPGLFGQVPFFREGQLTSRFVEGFGLSKREAELVPLVLDGLPNAAIGERLFISEKTVENHLTNILRKTGTKNRLQLFRLVMSQAV
jgi:DNA-binding CsgD family transcriptional regulator